MIQEFICLGSGTSGCVPTIYCLLKDPPTCQVCISAIQHEKSLFLPKFNKNFRRNTSGLLRFKGKDGTIKNLLIDCGKTFYSAALQWFTEYKLQKIDAVLLTHGHADAMMGLDELRQWTFGTNGIQPFVDVYLNQETYEVVSRSFPYIVDTSQATGSGEVPSVKFHIINEEPFTIDQLEIIPFPVEHGFKSDGSPYYAFGYRMQDFAYVSDVSKLTAKASQILQGTKTLILDALRMRPHASHFSVDEAIQAAKTYVTGKTFLIGITHETDHDELEAYVQAQDPTISVGYDGLVIQL